MKFTDQIKITVSSVQYLLKLIETLNFINNESDFYNNISDNNQNINKKFNVRKYKLHLNDDNFSINNKSEFYNDIFSNNKDINKELIVKDYDNYIIILEMLNHIFQALLYF